MPALVSRGRGRRSINEINMVPFIDVMLVLLIIFMVTAPLITTGVVELPSVGKSQQRPGSVIEIVIGTDERLRLRLIDGSQAAEPAAVTLAQLPARVRSTQAGNADMPVVISADRNVKYDSVVRVMDTLQKAGVKRVGLSVKQGS
ncbi:ExbD/TolR family protein [Rubrivivax sp. RP6-9]|uniref:ExbD/TolR family protein n=1 Tax=Rubrivivax sp. RP6-9 TaxID=3415750 RepID=UPI003CC5A62F